MTTAILVLVVALAAANGSNDVPKGVATLAGAGVTRYRTAILWGGAATFAGSLVSLQFADRLTKLFSKGIVTADPTPAFALAVLGGTAAWVGFATIARLPVSTTHAIVGSLVGAGLLLASGAVDFGAVAPRVAQPLLLSIGAAYGLSFLLSLLPDRVPECVCVELGASAPATPGLATPDGTSLLSPAPPVPPVVGLPVPVAHVTAGSVADCAMHGGAATGMRRMGVSINGLHWLSSGATSFARGLNDTPKIVAVGGFALVPAGMTTAQVLRVVAVAMLAGSLVGGMRVARRLGEGVVKMSHVEGFKANLTTALLVGLAANRGLPLSTTHVSTGAIAGAAGGEVNRINARNLRDFVLAWTVTPLFAGLVAAGLFMLVR